MVTQLTVDAYIAALKEPLREPASLLRALVLETVPAATESIKWAQPVFSVNGPFCYIKAYNNHLNFGFWRGVSLSNTSGLIQSGGKAMGHVRIDPTTVIDRPQLRALIVEAAQLNLELGDPSRTQK